MSVGECFGICNLLARFELETVLRCAIETEVLYIPKSVLQEVMSCNGAFALRFAAVCSEKIQFLLKRIELLTMQSCRGRVIAFLLAGQNENREVIFRGSREDRHGIWESAGQRCFGNWLLSSPRALLKPAEIGFMSQI